MAIKQKAPLSDDKSAFDKNYDTENNSKAKQQPLKHQCIKINKSAAHFIAQDNFTYKNMAGLLTYDTVQHTAKHTFSDRSNG